MTKSISFYRTTKGHVGEVNGVTTWFIRQEKDEWIVYRSEDGGKTFKLIPYSHTVYADGYDEYVWGYDNLNQAKAAIYSFELI